MGSTGDAMGFAGFAGNKYLNLETFKKSGQGVKTPVWFAADPSAKLDSNNARLYVYTIGVSGKVKRIRNNSHVSVAPSDRIGNVSGPTISGIAKLLSQDEAPVADAALNRKYGEERQRVLAAMGGRNPAETAYIEISPAQDAN